MTLTLDIENVQLRSASEWIELLESKSGVLAISKRLFGCEESDIEDFKNTEPSARKRIDLYLKGIKGFVETYPTLSNEPLFIVRSPARLNLRGMHIDNHGGRCNGFAIDRETVIVAARKSIDDSQPRIHLTNANPEFNPAFNFTISQLETQHSELHNELKHCWRKYVLGALISLREYAALPLQPFTGYVIGDIPTGAAAASSHTFVLSIILSALASIKLKEIKLVDIVLLGRQAEGKAGAVTGLADQGLMVFSRPGEVASSPFYQGDIEAIKPTYAKFPQHDVSVLMVDSLKRRNLAGAEAKDYAIPRFAYSVALGLLKEAMIQAKKYSNEFISSTDRLSFINPNRFSKELNTTVDNGTIAIYELLKLIPEKANVEELVAKYPSLVETINKAKESYLTKIPAEFQPKEVRQLHLSLLSKQVDLRGALLYGISECARAEEYICILQKQDDQVSTLTRLGKLMNIGHDGDHKEEGRRIDDKYLDGLITKINEGGSAPLWEQPGDFRASTVELDDIQRILLKSGAYGSCLTGAGLGGVVIGIIPSSSVEVAKQTLQKYFEEKRKVEKNIEELIHLVKPVAGTGYLTI